MIRIENEGIITGLFMLATLAFAIVAIMGSVATKELRDDVEDLNSVIGYMFRDYCAPYGGVIKLLDTKVIMDEIDPDKPAIYMGCARNPDAGVLVIQDDSVVYYVPEDDE